MQLQWQQRRFLDTWAKKLGRIHQMGLFPTVYYWETLEALLALTQHPKHLAAKAAQGNWLDGYQVIISEIIKSYGDSKLIHLPTAR